MDYDFSASQQCVIATVDRVIDASGGIDRAFALAVAAGYDRELDRALAAAGVLDGSDLLERVLVAERLAELGVATTYGMRGVIDVDGLLPPGASVRQLAGPSRATSTMGGLLFPSYISKIS